MMKQLWNDEMGFIISAELVLVATILVIGMIVGLSQVQHAVVQELNDVACAIGALDQSFRFIGFASGTHAGHFKAFTVGSIFKDEPDECDCDDVVCNLPLPTGECGFP